MPSHVYTQLYYHINWHTKGNLGWISEEMEQPLYNFIRQRARAAQGVEFWEIGGTEDHIHLAIRFPPSLVLSEWIGDIKGSSSFYMNRRFPRMRHLWQQGFGAVSFSGKHLPIIIEYIRHQKEHHAKESTIEELERCTLDEEEEQEKPRNHVADASAR
jgi:putative transposase